MPVVQPETLSKLQHQGAGIRNICILAHVDHGKTSLTDALIATNGIISPKLAGKIRYLDSRPDEQLRGITMESSAISLYFSLLRRTAPDAQPEKGEYLINLIDSPGHIDFSSEVSTASRLCDGALVLVDAVEGVCSQTVTVLRQTWTEKLKPILVINKMDRLIMELKLTPSEAYTHLSKLIEQVNAVMGSFALGERMEDDLRWRERIDEKVSASAAAKDQDISEEKDRKSKTNDDQDADVQTVSSAEYEEKDDDGIYFEPERNNVIFSSAIDGWAFTPRQFAGIYEKKLGMKRSALEKVLWGDYYLDPKTKRVLGAKHLKGRNLKPMFVQLVLEQVWAAYEATVGGSSGKGDSALLEKITKSLNITIPAHLLRSRDPKALLNAVFAAWLPLSTAVLVSVIEHLPSPRAAQESRIPALLDASPGFCHIDGSLRESMIHMNSHLGEPTVAYISKMISIPESELPINKRRGGALTAEEARELGRKKRAEIARAQAQANEGSVSVASVTDALSAAAIGDDDEVEAEDNAEEEKDDPEHLIGFARLYSGTLTVGDEVYILPPKFTPANPHVSPQPKKVTITGLYLLMGRSLETLNSVPAGNVVGIAGLEGAILKSGTISSRLEGSPNLSSTSAISTNAPIVRVALEPAFPGDLDKMIKGLHLLEQADPAVSYEQLESGEHVILTAGELHLERCLKDLKDRFAKCDIQAGEAIVPYRESIVKAEEMNAPRDPTLGRGRGEELTSSKQVRIRLSVRPLPTPVTEFLVRHTGAVKRLYSERKAQELERTTNGSSADKETDESHDIEQDLDVDDPTAGGNHLTMAEFKHQLSEAFTKDKADREIWKDAVEKITAFGPRRIGPNVLIDATSSGICGRFLCDEREHTASDASSVALSAIFADKISHAFQLETNQGPLCHEPMQGIAVFLEDVNTELSDEEIGTNAGRLTGEIIRTVRETMRQGFLDWSPRILLAMYSCEIQASAEVLGRVYSVITRRRGRIVSESLLEPSTNFTILALLPVAESFGFSDEIRQRTSGFATPQLVFEGYEMLDEDPFWVPFTEEELEDLGEKADKENVAKRYVDAVRERKGLAVKRKVVESAEKQKTLKR